ncbi:AMP-binding protein [Plantactinospora sp. KBS50]|uniref:AMP-binding protein n=1 Tax=Plantactinospora sp. KBS50 TaxID=2024580 RepID=UPI001E431711|nr:AMP-binding protein [Plantactinospora sp. KBS50]
MTAVLRNRAEPVAGGPGATDPAAGNGSGPGPVAVIDDLLRTAAARHPDAPAVTDRQGRWSYAELAAAGASCAAWLAGLGVRPGTGWWAGSATPASSWRCCSAPWPAARCSCR